MLLSNYNPVLSTVLARHSQCGRGSALTKLAPIPNAILGARNGREISHDKGVMDPQQRGKNKGEGLYSKNSTREDHRSEICHVFGKNATFSRFHNGRLTAIQIERLCAALFHNLGELGA